MSALTDYLLGVSQNLVAAGVAVTAHHHWRVRPMVRMFEDYMEGFRAEETRSQTEARSPQEGLR